MVAAPASAQTAPADAPLRLEAVAVTGSNLKRIDLEHTLPVTVLNREAMEARNALTPIELLTSLPQVTNVPLNESTAPATHARGDNANINLRGIGISNTLVLLNGRRLAPHPMTAPDAAMLAFSVNVNQLPTQGVDRIDVLRDGASSIYGSDAVAGVINFITRRDLRGTTLRTRTSAPEHGQGQAFEGTVLHGGEFAKGRGRHTSVATAFWREPIRLSDRAQSRSANHSAKAPAPFNVPGSVFDGRATVGDWPVFRVGSSATSHYFRPVGGTPMLTTVAPTRAANPEYYLDINAYQNFGGSKSARQNWFTGLEYDLTDRVTAFADISFYHATTQVTRQPVLLNAPGIDQLKPLSIDNPYNPYGARFYHPTGAPNPDGTPRLTGTPQPITLLALSFKELAGENIRVASHVYRGVAGLRGKLTSEWTWEVGALHTRARTSDVSPLALRESALASALQRTDASAFNPFGYTFRIANGAVIPDRAYTNPASALAPIMDTWRRDGMSAITGGDWRVAGPVLSYWGNTASTAIGGEARYEEFRDRRPDYVGTNPAGSGLDPHDNDYVLFSPKPNSRGTRTVYSSYAEAAIPLVAPQHGIPLLRSLEVTASARHERYSDFGHTTEPKIGLTHRVHAGLLLRASYNEGFTAPNLPTLYAPSQFSVDTAPGATDVFRTLAGLSDATYPQRYYATGNPRLQPTTAEGRSAGLVLDVPKVRGLTLTADYWKIEQEQIVGGRSTSQILTSDAALLTAYIQSQRAAGRSAAQIDLGSGTPNYKGDPAVVRFAPDANDAAAFAAANAGKPADQQAPVAGRIFSRYAPYENIAAGAASGIDLSVHYRLPASALGHFVLHSDWSYLAGSNLSRTLTGAGTVMTERMEVDGAARWRGSASLSWRRAGWQASASAYYTGRYADSAAVTSAATYEALGRPAYLAKQFSDGAYVYRYVVRDVISANAHLGRRFGAEAPRWLRGSSVRLGVVNATDREPPLASGNLGYSAAVHGGLFAGRTWTLEISREL